MDIHDTEQRSINLRKRQCMQSTSAMKEEIHKSKAFHSNDHLEPMHYTNESEQEDYINRVDRLNDEPVRFRKYKRAKTTYYRRIKRDLPVILLLFVLIMGIWKVIEIFIHFIF